MKENAVYAAKYTVRVNRAADLQRRFPQNNIQDHWVESEVGFDAEDGVYRWTSNGNIPPADCYNSHSIDQLPNFDLKKQLAVHERELAAFFEEYRRHQPAEPSAEELYEARAAHGPGVELVDVISGRRFTT